MPRRSFQSPFSLSVLSSERGSAGLSYAVFLGIIVGAIILGAGLLGDQGRNSYESLAGKFGPPGSSAPTDDFKSADSTHTQTTPSSTTTPRAMISPAVALQCGAILIGTIIYCLLANRRPKPEAFDEEIAKHDANESENEERIYSKRQQILTSLCQHSDELERGLLTVRQLMTSNVTSVEPNLTLHDARQTMAELKLRHLLVCEGEILVGVLSDRDVHKPGKLVKDVMTKNPLSVHPDSMINPAVTLLMRKRISCLPVVDNGRLVGLFTTTDLIMTLQCAFQLLQSSATHLDLRRSSDGSRPGDQRSTSAEKSQTSAHAVAAV